ncbi:CNNM domain-containing protein [Coxiella-like endosymbiont]|uniref:CNNM domain-containing protein n=1 Tax=Coxiella-like endosymbiont TaxID=1592897 RepID=UPI00272CC6DD|nr:CNNM domain-containing protein [Coxiella-like endosymbiont]
MVTLSPIFWLRRLPPFSVIVIVIAIHFLGYLGVIVATVILTLLILILAETTPKTLGALHSQQVAFPTALPIKILLRVLYPLVLLINTIANGFLHIFIVKVAAHLPKTLSPEELRSIVRKVIGKIIGKNLSGYQQMLL